MWKKQHSEKGSAKDPGSHILLLTGRVQGGKTTIAGELVGTHTRKGLRVAGFLCEGTIRDGERDSFMLRELTTDIVMPLATADFREGWTRYRRFYFNPATMEQARNMVLASLEDRPALIVIDEVGPMELEGSGWYSLLEELSRMESIPQLWVARDGVVEQVREKWGIPGENVFRAGPRMDQQDREQLTGSLVEHLIKRIAAG